MIRISTSSAEEFDSAVLRMRRFGWRHPEWWTLALSLAAWVVLFFENDHRHHAPYTYASSLRHAVLMVVAMMPPLVLIPVRLAAFRSLWARRHIAMAELLVAYVGIWSVVYVMIGSALTSVGASPKLPPVAAAAVGLSIATVWQVTPRKRRALRACHTISPLAPEGWSAHRDCLRCGLVTAAACISNCWALMLVPALVPSNFALMAGITILCGFERYARRPGRDPSVLAIILGTLALSCAIGAVASS